MPGPSHLGGRQQLGDFEIGREIGRGGMGIVYEARQISLNRRVALKVLSVGSGLSSKAVARFRREAAAAAKLHHTNIVPVYATGEEDGTHFYVMELIEGPSLDAVVRAMRKDERFNDTRVIMASGMNLKDECLAGGADDFLLKPYMPDDLINLLKKYSS